MTRHSSGPRGPWRLAFLGLVLVVGMGSSCQRPDALLLSLGAVENDAISGSVGGCSFGGTPASPGSCELSVHATLRGSATVEGSGTVDLPVTGGAFRISGLEPGTTYRVVARANAGAVRSQRVIVTTTNAAPDAPSLSGVVAPDNETIEGTLSACADDGVPNACTQSALLTTTASTCSPQGSGFVCTGGVLATTPIAEDGGFRFTRDADGVAGDTGYRVWGVSSDGISAALGAAVDVTTPLTMAGCTPGAAFQRTAFEAPPAATLVAESGSERAQRNAGLQNGGIAELRITERVAPDAAFGGFTRTLLRVGVDGEDVAEEWIEVGITDGGPGAAADGLRYVSRYGDTSRGLLLTQVWSGRTPVAGTEETVKIVSCASGAEPGCAGSGAEWIACVNTTDVGGITASSHCFPWSRAQILADFEESVDALGPGAADLEVGLETTCRENARLEPARIRDIRFRTPALFWSNVANLHVERTGLETDGADIACCRGALDPGICRAPQDVFTSLNPSGPATTHAACGN